MKKLKIYLDTSVLSSYYDFTKPMRQNITEKWFINESHKYDLYISTITTNEINEFLNIEKRNHIIELINKYDISLIEVNEDTEKLAKLYIKNGAIPKSEPEDALHIAVATINVIESLASWNFKHIVSINPIRKINQLNKKEGYVSINIGSLEIFGGAKYGNL